MEVRSIHTQLLFIDIRGISDYGSLQRWLENYYLGIR